MKNNRLEAQVGMIYQVEILDISHEGDGIGRINLSGDSVVVFVPYTCVGDIVKVRISKVKKTLLIGEMIALISPSAYRISSDCEFFGVCGGCELRHINFEYEKALKTKQVVSNLSKIGKLGEANKDYILDEGIFGESYLRYRNNVQFPIRKLASSAKPSFGFFERGSNRLCEINDCLLLPKEFIQIAEGFCQRLDNLGTSVYDDKSGKGLVRHLFLRRATASNETMVCIVINAEKKFFSARQENLRFEKEIVDFFNKQFLNIKTVVLNFNTKKTGQVLGYSEKILFGEGYICDNVLGNNFRISANSFYQVNHPIMEQLYRRAGEYIGNDFAKSGVLLDLYCGIGTIGLSVADKAEKVIGIELITSAVENAKQNAVQSGKLNCDFYQSDAKNFITVFDKNKLKKPSVIIVDPPRKGVDSEAISDIIKLAPDKIICISCNSATLARDIALLGACYRLERITVANMFPRTSHVECIVLMTYCGGRKNHGI